MNEKMRKKINAETQRRFQHRCKIEAIQHYGGKCYRCGEKRQEFLTIIKNPKNKMKIKAGLQIAPWLRRHGWPRGWQTVCYNCKFRMKFLKPKVDGLKRKNKN